MEKYINEIDYLHDLLGIVKDKNCDCFSISEYDSVYQDILDYEEDDFEDWEEEDFKEFIDYLKDLIITGIKEEVLDNE